jgi:hypothetical protein
VPITIHSVPEEPFKLVAGQETFDGYATNIAEPNGAEQQRRADLYLRVANAMGLKIEIRHHPCPYSRSRMYPTYQIPEGAWSVWSVWSEQRLPGEYWDRLADEQKGFWSWSSDDIARRKAVGTTT